MGLARARRRDERAGKEGRRDVIPHSRTRAASGADATATPLNTYYLLACADDLNVVAEADEGDNCVATATATVTVTRPDLAQEAVSPPPATKGRGTRFPVTDTVRNVGAVASGASSTRYYLSLDAVKSAGDVLLTGSRAVPGVAGGAAHSGTITVTIPTATPLGAYFLLACADSGNTVVETSETNNCAASGSTVTITPYRAPRPRPASDWHGERDETSSRRASNRVADRTGDHDRGWRARWLDGRRRRQDDYASGAMKDSELSGTVQELILLVEESPEGGFIARALGESIFTEADGPADLHDTVRDAVRCHFDGGQLPKIIQLHFVREEVIAGSAQASSPRMPATTRQPRSMV